jgi:DNA invertase Pin-like site-specific DNA recombinase
MLIGYARVSTDDQETALQIDALKAAGCERIFEEKASGARTDRPELARLLDAARKGDVVVVWKLDRLSRSLVHMIETAEMLHGRGVQMRSLTESIVDTTTPSGKMIFGIFAVIAEFEKDQLRQRTMAGLAAARARGRVGGRPRSLDADAIKTARALLESGQFTRAEIAAKVGASRHTLWRALTRPTQ